MSSPDTDLGTSASPSKVDEVRIGDTVTRHGRVGLGRNNAGGDRRTDAAEAGVVAGTDHGPEIREHAEYQTGFLLQLETFFQTFIAAYAGLNELMPIVHTDDFRGYLRGAFDETFEPPSDGQIPTLSGGVTSNPLFHKVALALVDEFADQARRRHSNENYPEALQYLFLSACCADMANCDTPDEIPGLYRAILRDSIGCDCRARRSFDDLIKHCEHLLAPKHRGFGSRETPYREPCPGMPDSYLGVDGKAMATYPLAGLIRYAMQAASACDWKRVLFFQEILADDSPEGFSSNYYLAVALESRAIQLERLGKFNDALRCLEEAIETREFLSGAARAVHDAMDVVTIRSFTTRKNREQIEALKKRQEIVRANLEANERYGFEKNEPSSVDEANWPERLEEAAEDMISSYPTEILLRYSEQAEGDTNPDLVDLRILINIEIAKRRPGVYLNQLILSREFARAGRSLDELLARIAMEELYPSASADSPNIKVINQIVGLLEDTDALRHPPTTTRRLEIVLCKTRGEPISYASTAAIVEIRGPNVTLSRETTEEPAGAAAVCAAEEGSAAEASGPVGQARDFIEIDPATRAKYARLKAGQASRAARGRPPRGSPAAIPEATSPLHGSSRDRETCSGFLQSLRSTMIRRWRCVRDEIFTVPTADRENLIRDFEDLQRTAAARSIGGVDEYIDQILRTIRDGGEIDAGTVRNLTEAFPRDHGHIPLRFDPLNSDLDRSSVDKFLASLMTGVQAWPMTEGHLTRHKIPQDANKERLIADLEYIGEIAGAIFPGRDRDRSKFQGARGNIIGSVINGNRIDEKAIAVMIELLPSEIANKPMHRE